MSKIGTAHIEIKPVLNEDALAEICDRIADAVASGVERGMAAANTPSKPFTRIHFEGTRSAE